MAENTLTIPDKTVCIEAGAYKGQTCTQIVFPASLREIGESAFEGCEQITYLKFPSGLEKIGAKAFYGCTSLGEIFISESVVEIGEEAFSEFGLIYCETPNPFPDGWLYEERKPPYESSAEVNHAEYHTWCGNYRYELTDDGYIMDNQDLRMSPLRKCLFGRQEKHIHMIQGIFYYDLIQYILDLGEDNLRSGKVPNMNPIMTILQQNLMEMVESILSDSKSVLYWMTVYAETVVEPFSDLRHNEEGAFISWGMTHLVWQQMQISDSPDRYQEVEEIALTQREKMHKLLVSFDDRWETILNQLEQASFTIAKLFAWVKAYYEKGERWREERIFSAYHELYFGDSKEVSSEIAQEGEDCYQQAVELIGRDEYDEAGKLFGRAAKCGHAAGQYNYGISVIKGEGCKADPLEGCYWYSEAASQGHAKAMMNLAICYRNGTGVLQSGIKMMEWYAKAAYCLLPEAVYNLGLSLKHEEVIKGNTELGTTLINASEDVEDYSATQGFVKKVAEMILEALEQFRADNEGGSV